MSDEKHRLLIDDNEEMTTQKQPLSASECHLLGSHIRPLPCVVGPRGVDLRY